MTWYATHPLSLFLLVWSMVTALYWAGVFVGLFPAPHALTVVALLLNAGTFSLGYLTWTLLRGLAPQRAELLSAHVHPALPRHIQRALAFTLLMGAIALLLMLHRASQMAAYSSVGLYQLLTNPQLLRTRYVEFIEMSAWQTSPETMLTSLTSGLFAMGFILLGVFLRLDTTVRRYAYLLGFLAIGLATCLMNLSRYDMTASVLYLLLGYGMTPAPARDQKRPRVLRDVLPPLAAVVLIFAVVELLLRKSATYGESGSARSILFSFYWYLASPIAALNDFLAGFAGDYGWGERTLAPFFKWLHRFHLVAPHDFSVFGEFVCIPYPANAYTYLRSFYEDFGLLGVAAVPYLLGSLMAAIQDQARRHFQYLNLYVLVLVPLLFSFFFFPLISTQFYLQVLFGFLFFRYEMLDEQRLDA